ncbi:MAG: FAD-dependent oxidoreductase [Chloroflexi bacterium]|nr:FAD-dependent oxidoreductase [Chloroflexota bacterium]
MANDLGTLIETDVLILGGGLSGIFAALAVRDRGEQHFEALIVDKAYIERSGQSGAGNDHYMSQLYTDPSWDTDIDMAEQLPRMRDTFMDPQMALNVARYIPVCKDILEGLGIEFLRDPVTGEYKRTQGFGAKGPFWMMVVPESAKRLKPVLVEALRQKGVKMVNRVMVTRLLVEEGQVVGATGFNVRTGEFYTFRARAVIFASGDVSRTSAPASTRNPFNIWRSPFNTGDGHAIAWRAGIELEDMGIMRGTLIPKGFGAAGVAALVALDGYLINSLGERYMFRYSPRGERAVRSTLLFGTFKEIQEGRGPCYFDLRHLPPDTGTFLCNDLLAVDKNTYGDYLAQKGLDLSKHLLEQEIGEFTKSSGGIATNADLETNVPRVYAAGQCGPGGTFPCAAASGFLAGLNAVSACAEARVRGKLNPDEAAAEKRRVFAPLQRSDGISPKKFEEVIRSINERYVAIMRNEGGLQAGLRGLRKLGEHVITIKATNYHELMRANEAINVHLCSELICLFSLDRKESRFGSSFYRSDFPESDPTLNGMMFMRQDQGEIVKRFQTVDPKAYDRMRSA